MIRFLMSVVVFFVSALIGVIVADLLLPDFTIDGATGYLLVAAIFAIIQGILSPFIFKVVAKNASAFTGGVGIVATLVALIITDLLLSSLTITGISTWILAALIVWLAGAIAAFILPFLLVKRVVEERRA